MFEGLPIELYELDKIEIGDGEDTKEATLITGVGGAIPSPLVFETGAGKRQFFATSLSHDGGPFSAQRKDIVHDYVEQNWKWLFGLTRPFGDAMAYHQDKNEWRCADCGGELDGDAVGLVRRLTVFKRAPGGASDLRIALARVVIYSVVGQLECPQCGLQWVREA